MALIKFDLARTSRDPGWNPDLAAAHDALWRQFVIGATYTADGSASLVTATTVAGNGFTFDSAQGDIGFKRVTFADGGGAIGTASASRPSVVTLDWITADSAVLRLDTTWNSIKNAEVSQFTGTSLRVENFVDAWIHLSDDIGRSLTVDGAKRGEVTTGGGNDTITIGIDSNSSGWTNEFLVVSGDGNDLITYRMSERNMVGDAYRGQWTTTTTRAGDGDDTVQGWGSDEIVDGGAGNDVFVLRGLITGYTITTTAGVTTIVDIRRKDGNDGRDRLTNVEKVRFGDGTVLDLLPPTTDAAPIAGDDTVLLEAPAPGSTLGPVDLTAGLLDNDIDPEGLALTITAVGPSTLGKVTLAAGVVTFRLDDATYRALGAGEMVTADFTYTVRDAGGLTDTAAARLVVKGVNDTASISGLATGAVAEDGALSASGDLDVADADAGQAVFAAPASLAGSYGSFSFDAATGAWGYLLDNALAQALSAGQTVTDTLAVTSLDGTAIQAITVSIAGANDAPVFDVTKLAFSLPENTTAVGSVAASDAEGDPIGFAIVSGADGALFTIDAATGALAFATAPDFEAPLSQAGGNVYTINLRASDGQGGSTLASVAVTVTDVAETEAPSLVVTTLKDVVDAHDGLTSLREAIAYANGKVGADTVTFAAGLHGTILLGDADGDGAVSGAEAASQLRVTEALTIDGRSPAGGLGAITIDGGGTTRILRAEAGLTVQGLTLTRGNAGAESGGAILASTAGGAGGSPLSLTLADSAVTASKALDGGGIALPVGTLTLTRSVLSGNTADPKGGAGGGLYADIVSLTDSALLGNLATAGGGLFATTATLVNSTVAANAASDGAGGGLHAVTLRLHQSTVTGNTANGEAGFGGGFIAVSATLSNSIVLGNTASVGNETFVGSAPTNADLNIVGFGGDTSGADGVINAASAGAVFAQTVGFLDRNGNGVQEPGETALPGGVQAGRIADNGGPVPTVALAPSAANPALDAARAVPETTAGVDFNGSGGVLQAGVTGVLGRDARGVAAADVPGVGAEGAVPGIRDLGAFEATPEAASLVVTTLRDVVDPFDGLTSLREAIAYANRKPGADSIAFDADLAGTILLGDRDGDGAVTGDETASQLLVTEALTIDGRGAAGGLGPITIDGGDRTRILLAEADLTLQGLTLTRGNAGVDFGGAILSALFNASTGVERALALTVTDSAITANQAAGGGGIEKGLGTLSMARTTVSENSAGDGEGGGISARTALITDSTLFGNTAKFGGGLSAGLATLVNTTVAFNAAIDGVGGGVYAAELRLIQSTVTGNTAGDEAGGVRSFNTSVQNSIILGNTAPNIPITGEGRFGGDLEWLGLNISGTRLDANGSDGVIGVESVSAVFAETVGFRDANGNGVQDAGEDNLPGGAVAGRLADNGGPVPTVALTAAMGNPALDAARAVAETAAGLDFDNNGVLEAGVTGVVALDATGRPAVDVPVIGAEGTAPGIRDLGAAELQDAGAIPPGSLVVTTLRDVLDPNDGLTSLREAIQYANAKLGVDTITFAPGLAGTILLGDRNGDGDTSDAGEVASALVVSEALVIDGNGSADGRGPIVLDGGLATRILNVGADLTLDGLTLTHGRSGGVGGAISGSGVTVTLIDSTVRDSIAAVGGGIGLGGNGARVHLQDSIIANNVATGPNVPGFIENGGGIALSGGGSSVTGSGAIIIGNQAAGGGGGIQGDIVDLQDSLVAYNAANGGGLLSDPSPGRGGGILATTVSLTDSVVSHNDGYAGGGVYAIRVTATRSLFDGNLAAGPPNALGGYDLVQGGAIYAGDKVTLVDSTVAGNAALMELIAVGGGVYTDGTAIAENTTFFGNVNGALAAKDASLSQVTMAGNSSRFLYVYAPGLSPALDSIEFPAASTATVANSLLLDANWIGGGNADRRPIALTQTGNNVVAGSENINIVGVDPSLDPTYFDTALGFGDHGGPVPTLALRNAAGNPALDSAGAGALPTDARGGAAVDVFAADTDGQVRDLGAYELGATPSGSKAGPSTDLFVFANANATVAVTGYDAGDLLLFNTASFGIGPHALITGAELGSTVLAAGDFFLDTAGADQGNLYFGTGATPTLVATIAGTALPTEYDLVFWTL